MLRAREEVPTEATMLGYYTSNRDADGYILLHVCDFAQPCMQLLYVKDVKVRRTAFVSKQARAIRYQDNVPHSCYEKKNKIVHLSQVD